MVDKKLISPESLHNSNVFADDFEMTLMFDDYCKDEFDKETGDIKKYACRSNKTRMEDLCKNCKVMMDDELQNWRKAHEILNSHDMPDVNQAR